MVTLPPTKSIIKRRGGRRLAQVYPVVFEMKPSVVVDEMFPEGAGSYMDLDEQSAGPSGMIVDLTSNEKAVHGDFYNGFADLCDDDDLS